MHCLQQIVYKQRRTGSPHMQAKKWKLWDRSLSFFPPDGGNVTIQWQFTNRTGQEKVCVWVSMCVYVCVNMYIYLTILFFIN